MCTTPPRVAPPLFHDRPMPCKPRVPLLRQDHDRLLDSDYRGKTVLMHAAGAGRSALFDVVLGAIGTSFSDNEVRHRGVYRTLLLRRSLTGKRDATNRFLEFHDHHVLPVVGRVEYNKIPSVAHEVNSYDIGRFGDRTAVQ